MHQLLFVFKKEAALQTDRVLTCLCELVCPLKARDRLLLYYERNKKANL